MFPYTNNTNNYKYFVYYSRQLITFKSLAAWLDIPDTDQCTTLRFSLPGISRTITPISFQPGNITRSPTVTKYLNIKRVRVHSIITFNTLHKYGTIMIIFFDLGDKTDHRLAAMCTFDTYKVTDFHHLILRAFMIMRSSAKIVSARPIGRSLYIFDPLAALVMGAASVSTTIQGFPPVRCFNP